MPTHSPVKDYRIPPTDRRMMRAQSLAHVILSVVCDTVMIDRRAEREIYSAVIDRLCDLGVDVITDDDRARAGLPPRDERGYTPEELHAIEAMRLQIMRAPIMAPFPGIEPSFAGPQPAAISPDRPERQKE